MVRQNISESEHALRRTWRLIGAAWVLAMVCAGAAVLELQAEAGAQAQRLDGAPTTRGAAPAPKAAPVSANAVETAPVAGAGEIQDDPTIVPDPHESADNNLTFPVDI